MHKKPKYKVCRRLGPGVYEKCQTDTYMLRSERKAANQRGRRRRRRLSEYGKQLLEKQKVRFTYGITERQFRRYVKEATGSRDQAPTEALYTLLESRLDNIVFRMGLAPSRRAARQLVTHGHVTVNGKKLDVPSHRVEKGDSVAVRQNSKDKKVFELRKEDMQEHDVPSWLVFKPDVLEGSVTGTPEAEEAMGLYDLISVLEFYSR